MNSATLQSVLQSRWWRPLVFCCLLLYVGLSIWLTLRPPPAPSALVDDVLTISTMQASPAPTLSAPRISDLPTQGWQVVALPHNWQRLWPLHNGVVWYRSSFERSASQLRHQALFIP